VSSIYRNNPESIIWDIFPEDFTANGFFEKLIQKWKNANFKELIQEERNRVYPFLQSWSKQLQESSAVSLEDLLELFIKTPSLSGVLYCSHSTVLSESFFNPTPEKIAHPTDRVISHKAVSTLPSANDLTFSFPRKYKFSGLSNSWGFARIERFDERNNGAGVLLSITTLDSEVLNLLKKEGFEHLANLYNQCWNGSIHDYIHHLALYTNPSFGIGSRSPMSLVGLSKEIDQWGNDMVDTFNYEYWAHRTHHSITEHMPVLDRQQIIRDAKNYFFEVGAFQKQLRLSGHKENYIHRIGEYLGSIYIWPLHVLIHPNGPEMKIISGFIDNLDLPQIKRIDEAYSLLTGEHCPSDSRVQAMITKITNKTEFLKSLSELDDTPLLKGISKALELIRINSDSPSFDKGEWLRFKTAITVQRGMYNCWDHNYPVIYQGKISDPLDVFSKIVAILKQTLDLFEPYLNENTSYELSGIHP
jgi:hypothetical protein